MLRDTVKTDDVIAAGGAPRPLWKRALFFSGLDIILPLVLYGAIWAGANNQVFTDGTTGIYRFEQGSTRALPSDSSGTIWFYWWVHQAAVKDKPVLWPDVVCAPGGQSLKHRFVSRIDALMAMPFLHFLEMPLAFNLFFLFIPVLGALAGYLGLRTLTSWRLLAWSGGLLFGFNLYTLEEGIIGRPVTSLVFEFPLILGAWILCLNARTRISMWIWAVATGTLGALIVHAYAPFALGAVSMVVIIGMGRAISPPGGISRLRPLKAGILAAVVALVLAMPYVHEVLVQRGMGLETDINEPRKEVLPFWNPRTWTEVGGTLGMMIPRLHNNSPHQPSSASQIKEQANHLFSMPIDYIVGGQARPHAASKWVTGTLSCVALMLALLAGRRGIGWLCLTLFLYTFTLGPYASRMVNNELVPISIGGSHLGTPLLLLMSSFKMLFALFGLLLERFFPLVLLSLIATMVVSVHILAERYRVRLPLAPKEGTLHSRLVDAVNGPGVFALGIVLGCSVLCCVTSYQLFQQKHNEIALSSWEVSPFIKWLSNRPDSESIIEMPLGVGHGAGTFQTIHRKRRAGGHSDLGSSQGMGADPPEDCFRLPLLKALWYLGRWDSVGQEVVARGMTSAAVDQARRVGFRYLMVYPQAYVRMEDDSGLNYHGAFDVARILGALQGLLGKPFYLDAYLIVYRLGEP